eukprot:316928_1
MSPVHTLLVFTVYWKLCSSSPCIPANTCFEKSGGDDIAFYDSSEMFTCDNGDVYKNVYKGTTCEDDKKDNGASGFVTLNGATGTLNTNAGTLDGGDETISSGSGAYNSDYLKGVGCPLLDSASDTCTEYFIVKHRGDKNYNRQYLDIGDNCTAYLTDPSEFTEYDSVYVPYGCVNIGSRSTMFDCNGNAGTWSWTHWNESDCTGSIQEAQTEAWVVDTCGYFSEWTHCKPPCAHMISGCVDCGLHDYWWYWYDLVCCPVGPTQCVPGAEPVTTSAPTDASSTTSSPTSTTSSTSGGSNTPQPTTPAPTSPGTAKPTTAAPTNTDGTAKPTHPTTAAPTSPGTAIPSVPTTLSPTSKDDVARKAIGFAVLCGFIFVMTL